jgi:hypothetical protein
MASIGLPTSGAGLAAKIAKPAVPKPVNLAQAFGNKGGKLPGYTYGGGRHGTFAYTGSQPVNMAQAYQNMTSGSGGASTGPAPAQIYRPPAPTPAPWDATAASNSASHLFDVNSKVAGLQQQEGYNNTALQAALGSLAYAEPRAELAAGENANRRGALFSSVYGQQLGDLINQYQGKQQGLTAQNTEKNAALDSQIAALLGGVPLYDAQQSADAGVRLSQQAANNPSVPTSTPPPAPKSAAPNLPPPPNARMLASKVPSGSRSTRAGDGGRTSAPPSLAKKMAGKGRR